MTTRGRRRLASTLAAILLLAGVTAGSDAIAGPPGSASTLVHATQGALRAWLLSPDGEHAIYLMRSHDFRHVDLFSVPTDGGPRVQLSESHVNAPHSFQVSPDSTTALWLQGQSLYAAPVTGGARRLLGFPVTEYATSPDSTTVVFVHGSGTDTAVSATAIDGSTSPTLLATSGGIDAAGFIPEGRLAVSPLGGTVVYTQTAANQQRLFAVPITGDAPARELSTSSMWVSAWWSFSPTGDHVVFQASSAGRSDLYAASLGPGGGGPVRLNDPAVEKYGDVVGPIDDSGGYTIFMTSSDGMGADAVALAPLDGGPTVNLAGPLAEGTIDQLGGLSSSGRVVLAEIDLVWHLIPIDGGPITPIPTSTPTGSITHVTLTPDGHSVLYIEKQPFMNNGELRRLPIDGGPPVVLAAEASVITKVTADSANVLFRQFSIESPAPLWMMPVAGGGATKLNGDLPASNVRVSADSTRVLFDHISGLILPETWLRSVDLRATPAEPALVRITTDPPLPSQVVVNGRPADTWGLTWAKLPAGTYEICFTDVAGWTSPPCSIVEAPPNGVTTSHVGSFTPRGQLRVVTEPPVPATVTIDGHPRNDWGVWIDVEPGTHEVCFGAAPGHVAPPCQSAVVAAAETTTVTGTYEPGVEPGAPSHGLLRVTTDPPVPAMISINGIERDRWGLQWLKVSRGVEHRVCFGDVPGFDTPRCRLVQFDELAVRSITGIYAPRGYIRVLTEPAVPSTIRIDGVPHNDWGVWTDIPTGDHEVCWSAVNGFAPPCQSVTVVAGETVTVTGEWPGG